MENCNEAYNAAHDKVKSMASEALVRYLFSRKYTGDRLIGINIIMYGLYTGGKIEERLREVA